MKLKDLIFNREKLRKYDELNEWKEKFEQNIVFIAQDCDGMYDGYVSINAPMPLPDEIKNIIVSSIDAEIAKLNEK